MVRVWWVCKGNPQGVRGDATIREGRGERPLVAIFADLGVFAYVLGVRGLGRGMHFVVLGEPVVDGGRDDQAEDDG